MDNLLFNKRFVFAEGEPAKPEPVVEALDEEATVEEAEPDSLKGMQKTLDEGRKDIYAHYRKLEGMAKENPAIAKMLENMKKESKTYQEYLAYMAKMKEKMSEEGILPYITPPAPTSFPKEDNEG